MSTGEQILVFLVKFKPLYGSYILEEELGHLTPIANSDTRPNDHYYGIKWMKEDGNVNGIEKPYTFSQIKDIIHACNSEKFDKLQSSASLLDDKSQHDDALKLLQDAYNMCPTGQVKSDIYFLNKTLEKKKLSWQLEQVGFPKLLFLTLLFLLFFSMGYHGKWRWVGMLFILYSGLIILMLPRNIPIVSTFSFLLPFISYGLGIFWYKAKKGTWPQDKVKEEMTEGFLKGEDENGSYVIWEHEKNIFSRASMIIMITLFLIGILLLNLSVDTTIPAPFILIPLIFSTPALIYSLMFFNKLRYRYGCHDKGYSYGVNDGRMELVSFLSVSIGTVDRNSTLAGSGLISYGVCGMTREWSSVEWCSYDDDKKTIVINHGCCKSDKLYASDISYNALKTIVMKAIGEKCTNIKQNRLEDKKPT